MALSTEGSGEPGDGGPVTGDYEVTGQEPDILVMSGNRVVQAETIYARELTFGIDFQFTIPRDEYMGAGPQASAGLRASWLQAIGNHPNVTAVYVTQDVNPQNLLRDYVFVTVGTPDTLQQAQTRILLDNANKPGAFQQIDDTYAALIRAGQPG
jgi:hypothetical protein